MLGKTKLTALAMAISFVFLGAKGDYSQAQETEAYKWPVPDSKIITQEYSDTHTGIDISTDKDDSEVVATKDGIVIAARSTDCKHIDNYPNYCCNSGMGNYVKIQHEDGMYSTYAHLKYGSVKVTEGQKVKAGDVIGIVGSSGRSKGTHLHFQINYSETKTLNTNQDKLTYSYIVNTVAAKKVVKTVDNVWSVTSKDGVNFRKGPSTKYDVIQLLLYGAEFEVSEIKDIDGHSWGKTNIGGNEGYVSLEYASKVEKQITVVDEKLCKVILDPCGGTVEHNMFQYGEGSEFGELAPAYREGYIFKGWYTGVEDGWEINPKYTVNEDTTLYARWEAE